MNDKMARLWATKTKDDEWWSSFVTAPLGLAINYVAVELPWATPNRITAASFFAAVLGTICIINGGTTSFVAAAVLIHLSHVLDCMDGQMARYRQLSSPMGSYFDRLTDQVQVVLWFTAASVAAYSQSLSATPVFLALIGIAFYGLRGYTKYIAHEIETARDPDYPAKMARCAKADSAAGPGFGIRVNLAWLLREQVKILRFDEGVFIFMLSVSLLLNQLEPMLWIFAASQVFWGFQRGILRGMRIHANQQCPIQK